MKKYKTPRTIREMQIKTTMKYHLTECPSLKSLQITNAGENIEKRQQSYTAGGNLIDIAAIETTMEAPHKIKDRVKIWSSNPTPGHTLRQNYSSNIHTPWCSLNPYLQYPRHENTLNVHWQMNGLKKYCTYT